MKDIDFDELDRAVSSVLGQKPSPDDDSAAAQDADTSTTSENVESQPEKSQEPVVEALAPEPAAAAPAPAPSLATKRRGKFMDVMHPSADMAPATPAPKPVRTVAPLTPITPVQAEPTEEPVSPTEQPVEPTASLDESSALIGAEPAPVESMLPEHIESSDVGMLTPDEPTSDATEPVEDRTDAKDATASSDDSVGSTPSLYVDPIEAAGAQAAVEAPAENADVAPVVTELQDETPAQPTPFLTDTKVDKRPLGAFGDADTAAPTDEPAPVTQPADAQGAPTVPLPRELQPDVVEVESTQETDSIQTATVPSAPGAQPAPHDDGRVEGHPLFDTSTYHEPIAAVHSKGMPGWVKWLIGLLICLALGAGVGYFLFTAGL